MFSWLAPRVLTGVTGALVVISLLMPQAASAAAAVTVDAPVSVTADVSNAITLHVPRNVAALEGRVLVEAGAAELVGVAPKGAGTALSPIAVPGGYAFGVYGLKAKKATTDIRLIFVSSVPGQLEVRILIDGAASAAGARLTLSAADLLSRVQVGRGSSVHRAPAGSPRSAPSRAGGNVRGLFGRLVISQDDIDMARAAWYSSHVGGTACGSLANATDDANGDGCVDIVDLQALSFSLGARVQSTTNAAARAANSAEAAALAAAAASTGVTAATGPTGKGLAKPAAAGSLTFVVTSTGDTPDATNGDGICADSTGQCTLRAALTESNWKAGQNIINFNLPGPAPVTIQVGPSRLSLVGSASSSVTIDGYSQPGSQSNTADFGTNAIPGVMVRGNGNSGSDFIFYVARPGNTIRGLMLNNSYSGVFLDTPASTGNRIIGNFMGFNTDYSLGQKGHAGVWLNNGAHDNFIGTAALADRNVVGNYDKAIYSYGSGTDHNTIQNNNVCLRPNGLGASCATGIDFDFGPKSALVGGSGAGEFNVVGPTTLNGIEMSHGWNPATNHDSTLAWQINDNQIIGNWVGFKPDGNYDPAYRSALQAPSSDNGQAIHAHDGCNYNLIEGNYVAAAYDGITIAMGNSTGNIVHANIIGVSPLGQPAPMARYGIYLTLNTRVNTVQGNTIRNAAGGGIMLIDPNVKQIRISQNIVSDTNGPGIYLAPDPNDPLTGANDLLAAPVITSASETVVAGTGIADATVELFQASRNPGQFGLPIEYLGSTTVTSDGHWSIAVTLVAGQKVTASQIAVNGDTSALAANVNVGSAPPAPVADFSWSQRTDALTVAFTDASTGAPSSWSWDFGDGTTSNEQNPTKNYSQPGDYTVTLTVTNGSGTDFHSRLVTVSQIAVGTMLAADAFNRTIGVGWGTSDIGGTYGYDGSVANFSVSNTSGRIVLSSANANRGALLNDVNARDVDAQVRVTLDHPATGSAAYAYLLLRRNGGNGYRPKLIFNTNGTVSVHVGALVNNAESPLGAPVVVPGLTQNGYIWIRAQVLGSNPTTINVKAWADGQPEPAAWQFTATDSRAALQGAGGVGLRAYLAPGSTNTPYSFRFDDLNVTAAALPAAGAVAADTFGRTVSAGWGNADVGGKYTLQGTASNYNVNGSAGTILLSGANQSRSATLDATSGANVEVLFRVAADKVAAGGTYYVYCALRRNGTNEYRPRLLFNANGTVSVGASLLNSGAESALAASVVVPGLTQSANGYIWVRAQATGASPTTINVKAWADGQAEPAGWQFTATDSLAAVQAAGSVGLRVYITGSVTTAPVTFSFDDLSIQLLP